MSMFFVIRVIVFVGFLVASIAVPSAPILASGQVQPEAAGGVLESDGRSELTEERFPLQIATNSRDTSGLSAQRPDTDSGLSLAELERIALLHNPALLKVQDQLNAARRKWLQKSDDARSKLQAEQEIRRTEQVLIAEQARVGRNLRTAYFVVVVLQRRVESTQELMETVKLVAKEAGGGAARQQVAGSRPLSQHRDHVTFTAELLKAAQQHHMLAWGRLASLTGKPSLAPSTLAGTTHPDNSNVTWDQIAQHFLTRSPQITVATARVNQSLSALQAAQIGIVRAGTAGANVGKVETILSNGQSNTVIDEQTTKVNEALTRLSVALGDLNRIESETLNRVRRAHRRFADAEYQAYIFSNAILPSAEEEMEFVEKRHKTGEYDTVDILAARRAHYHANSGQLAALLELSTALDELTTLASGTEGSRK